MLENGSRLRTHYLGLPDLLDLSQPNRPNGRACVLELAPNLAIHCLDLDGSWYMGLRKFAEGLIHFSQPDLLSFPGKSLFPSSPAIRDGTCKRAVKPRSARSARGQEIHSPTKGTELLREDHARSRTRLLCSGRPRSEVRRFRRFGGSRQSHETVLCRCAQ